MAKRRDKNSGAIIQHKDGRAKPYYGRIRLKTFTGEVRTYRTQHYSTPAEVDAELIQLREKSTNKKLPAPDKITLHQYLSTWIYDDDDIKPSTLESRELNVQRIKPILGNKPLKDIEPLDIFELDKRLQTSGGLRRDGLSASSRRQVWMLLQRAFADAVAYDPPYLPVSPFSQMNPKQKRKRTPVADKAPQRIYNKYELAALFNDPMMADQHKFFYILLNTIGCRSGELAGLHWSDIDWRNQKLLIQRTLQAEHSSKSKHGYREVTTKTKKIREVDLGLNAIAILEKLEQMQAASFQGLGTREGWHTAVLPALAARRWSLRNPGGFVIENGFGLPVKPGNMLHRLRRALERLGLPHARVHDLRHTFSHDLLNEGAPMLQLKESIGHSDISTTLNIYGHISNKTRKEATAISDRLLGETLRLAEVEKAGSPEEELSK